jgi:hypothetical protein
MAASINVTACCASHGVLYSTYSTCFAICKAKHNGLLQIICCSHWAHSAAATHRVVWKPCHQLPWEGTPTGGLAAKGNCYVGWCTGPTTKAAAADWQSRGSIDRINAWASVDYRPPASQLASQLVHGALRSWCCSNASAAKHTHPNNLACKAICPPTSCPTPPFELTSCG